MQNTFDTALGNDARLHARWEACRDTVLDRARAVGFDVPDPDSLKDLPGVKAAVFADFPLPVDILDELKRLVPAVSDQARKQELAKQLDEPESPLHQDLSRMNPAQRMNFGRELEAAKRAQEAAARAARPGLTAEEEERAIRMVMRMPTAAGRMDAARAAGLL